MQSSLNNSINTLHYTSFLSLDFWHELSKRKLEEYKLDDSIKPLLGTYKINNYKDNKANLNFDCNSFNKELNQINNSGPILCVIKGQFHNVNTIELFQNYNKQDAFKQITKSLYDQLESIVLKEENDDSTKYHYGFLNTFLLVTFADLKTHLFKYVFVSPLLNIEDLSIIRKDNLMNVISQEKLEGLDNCIKQVVQANLGKSFPQVFFIHKTTEGIIQAHTSFRKYFDSLKQGHENEHYACLIDSYNQDDKFGPSINTFLGLLIIFRMHSQHNMDNKAGLKHAKLIVLKDFLPASKNPNVKFAKSVLVEVDISSARLAKTMPEDKYPDFLGFENLNTVKTIDLRSQLDEKSLASSAVDLNIKLMKWRLLPELDIPKIQSLKVLLFGAGTLGCQIARALMGWGVKNISFVDYGRVSHSNPVRQTLYDFEDATSGGKPKAEAGADKLKKIFPDMNTKGYSVEIPMPGHFAETEEKKQQIVKNLNLLEELVSSHDVLYLLTDNRESRWLPTVLANKFNKICITVALGFDSFVVIRHGLPPNIYNSEVHGERLGCYFCNDILSPGNSMKDRTLDQMCTVTRPGLSFISSAYAAELLISLIHHPLSNAAPAFDDEKKVNEETPLGILPQHIRGNLSDFETKIFYSRAFPNCVACSEYVLNDYCNIRDDFIFKVLNDPDYLQDVTKISKMLDDAERDECISLNDSFGEDGDSDFIISKKSK